MSPRPAWIVDAIFSNPKEPRMTESPAKIWVMIEHDGAGWSVGDFSDCQTPTCDALFLRASPELVALVEGAKAYGDRFGSSRGTSDLIPGLHKAAAHYARSLQSKEPGHGE